MDSWVIDSLFQTLEIIQSQPGDGLDASRNVALNTPSSHEVLFTTEIEADSSAVRIQHYFPSHFFATPLQHRRTIHPFVIAPADCKC